MRHFVFILTTLVALNASAQQLIDGVAAIVGEKAILYSEVDQVTQLFAMQAQLPSYSSPEVIQQLRARALDELLNQQVLLEYARQETIEVEDRSVQMQLDQSLQNIESQYGSLRKAAEAFGVDHYKIKSYYEDQIRTNLLVEQVKMELFSGIKVSRREVEDFYETWQDSFPPKNPQVDFSILSVTVEMGADKMEKLRSQLLTIKGDIESGGISFEDAATQYSKDPGSAANGGSLGLVGRGVFVKPFEEAAFALDVGQMSGIVETQFGLHLLRLDDRQGEQVSISHILLMPVADDTDKQFTSDKLSAIRDDILAEKTTIADQVEIYVTDDFMKSRKGKMGMTDISLLPEDIHDLLLNIPLESLSMPIYSSDQFHLIMVHRRLAGGKVNLTDHWFDVENMSLEFKKRDRYQSWVDDQRNRMYIQIK
ncbi:MAG: peptidylprolyl isomerase [FCB group bacterium]|nr:peptidylprolyl isomerase [FCB group bacterium]MBL7027290.1 peptidylprolyl isomerase [Candidatus Neomarinimicrobiota bacterium]MBL7122260.1 peptidylprolyl isomerase [Candidatus Neomarinimicrobiota bacterium]